MTIMAQPDMGPELIYRTAHSVVATPSHRNPGIVDFYRVMGSMDAAEARRIVTARHIDLLVVCRAMSIETNATMPFLYTQLLRGDPPDWLETVRLPIHVGIDFAVFRVR
jgi:hypothetical protein